MYETYTFVIKTSSAQKGKARRINAKELGLQYYVSRICLTYYKAQCITVSKAYY